MKSIRYTYANMQSDAQTNPQQISPSITAASYAQVMDEIQKCERIIKIE